jgi:hypothetical protein
MVALIAEHIRHMIELKILFPLELFLIEKRITSDLVSLHLDMIQSGESWVPAPPQQRIVLSYTIMSNSKL